ncbi:hypothetical protein [Pseudomonas proteolytica]|uniref:hypothetical protein n=1 Tax=Pseudomonas proteolytica TaxID=219574 RepID=UPI001CB6FFFB|nr:hypothetical protein [Pseudomonas proteolytica]
MAQKKTQPTTQTLQQQLDGERRLVSFDSYDLSVRQLLDMFESGEIDVPPEYQRQFIWEAVAGAECNTVIGLKWAHRAA